MVNRYIYWRRYKIQETLYINNGTSVPFKVGTLGPHTVLPITISYPVVSSWISPKVWKLFSFKGDFSFGKSHKSSLITARTHSTFSGILLVAGLPECGPLWTDSRSPLKHVCQFYLHCTHCIVPKSLLHHPNSFHGRMFKLHAKCDADSLSYLLSHCECDSHTIRMLTEWCLPPPTDEYSGVITVHPCSF